MLTGKIKTTGRTIGAVLVTVCVPILAGVSCFAQKKANRANSEIGIADAEAMMDEADPSTARVRMSDLNQARMVFAEVQEQVRIATAKLDATTLERKQEMGRIRALMAATDGQIGLASANVQRLQERERQLLQDATRGKGAAGKSLPADHALQQPLAHLQSQIDAARSKVGQLTRSRAQLDQRLDDLHREQIQELLKAAVTPADAEGTRPAALERLLARQLNAKGQAEAHKQSSFEASGQK